VKNIYLVIKQELKHLSHDEFETLKELSHVAKNIHNVALYNIRQKFFKTGKYLKYKDNYHLCNKGWYLIRKGRARLVEQFPLVIQLLKVVDNPVCEAVAGIDDGSKHVGVAIVQKCNTTNKCVFKGTLDQRQDVKTLMTQRAGYRKQRRQNKRYRKPRFDNRGE